MVEVVLPSKYGFRVDAVHSQSEIELKKWTKIRQKKLQNDLKLQKSDVEIKKRVIIH